MTKTIVSDMENVNLFTQTDYFDTKFYLRLRKLRQQKTCAKLAKNIK